MPFLDALVARERGNNDAERFQKGTHRELLYGRCREEERGAREGGPEIGMAALTLAKMQIPQATQLGYLGLCVCVCTRGNVACDSRARNAL